MGSHRQVQANLAKSVRDLQTEIQAPGGAVTVCLPNKVMIQETFGLASTEEKKPFSQDTYFSIGSVSKTFTGLIALRLVDQGVLALDEFCQAIDQELPAAFSDITIKHLLTHTAGLYRDLPGDYFAHQRFPDFNQYIANFTSRHVTSAPGTYKYSNLGFVVLGHLIEMATRQPYKMQLNELFEAFGLDQVSLGISPLIQDKTASGYLFDRETKCFIKQPDYRDLGCLNPAGGIYLTLGEYTKYLQTILSGINGYSSNCYLKEDTWKLISTPHWTDELWTTGASLAWRLVRTDDDVILTHSGSIPGFTNTALISTQRKCAIAIATNAEGLHFQACLDLLKEIPLEEKQQKKLSNSQDLTEFAGTYYWLHPSRSISLEISNEGILEVPNSGIEPLVKPMSLAPLDKARFHVVGGLFDTEEAVFLYDEKGGVSGLYLGGSKFIKQRPKP